MNYIFEMNQNIALGVDIGGSHITCQLFNLETNRLEESSKVRIPVNGSGQKEEILQSWTKAILQSISGNRLSDLSGIGFAMPGPFDYLNGVGWFDEKVDKFSHLHGVDVKSELIQQLNLPADFPVRFLNDAACFAVGVANAEPASKYNRVLALTLGTGFGTTFIKNGMPVAGVDGIPDDGFLYHVPFLDSIADEYFSTRWFLKEYKRMTGKEAGGVKELTHIAEHDADVKELFHIFGKNLGSFLVPWSKKFNTGCIVMGGNIAKSYPIFDTALSDVFRNESIKTEIVISSLDEDAALIGSARLSDNSFYQNLVETQIIK